MLFYQLVKLLSKIVYCFAPIVVNCIAEMIVIAFPASAACLRMAAAILPLL
ncbi:hypothetical protein CFter6_2336 [Collimonas fungivorans]|uniref:Uncharacterized protein n=1 Tax=Collimonas fungivorans TaxID=158899 RepID=A0A127PBI5_9BURK|nr:hypothetical protein CFter6_2336 [Collimonas fungivorans]